MSTTREHAGGSAGQASRKRKASHLSQKDQAKRNRRAVWCGFLIALIGYAILAARNVALSPLLALLLIPALAGVIVNRLQASSRPPRPAFFTGMKAAGWAMLFYAAIMLCVISSGLGTVDGAGQRFLAGVLVTIVYSLVAGSVAGLVNAALVRILARREEHGAAP